jgi:hypothetical protein
MASSHLFFSQIVMAHDLGAKHTKKVAGFEELPHAPSRTQSRRTVRTPDGPEPWTLSALALPAPGLWFLQRKP